MKTTASTETPHVITPRASHTSAPEVLEAMLAISQSPAANLLDRGLLDLVRLRASQLNRCGFCLDMHFRDAKAGGETDERLALLPAWEEVSCYTPRERAALRWTEAVTRLGEHGVSAEIFAEARAHFSEKELFHLTLAIVVINGWNRFNVAFHIQPGAAA
ncbi:MAG: carboxymuconolactone decarboxylase family protein [Opitutae bacterium]|nr:carboxymuconolactone decarboxylase family protein [Opitutae bacterium]